MAAPAGTGGPARTSLRLLYALAVRAQSREKWAAKLRITRPATCSDVLRASDTMD